MKNVRLYLVRHGITKGNLERRYVGAQTDEELCQKGREQLLGLYDSYTYPACTTVFSSPLARCVQTADILFPIAGNKIIIDDLRECGFGEFENKSFDELSSNPNFNKWLSSSKEYTPINAEPVLAFHNRCADALMKIFEFMLKSNLSEAACVTHGGVIMSMLSQCALLQKAPEAWMADSGCGYEVQCSAAMYMRDKACEVTQIIPYGYLDEKLNDESLVKD